MNALTANEAKTHFGDMLLKAQRAPIQINKNGKPVAVVMSADDFQQLKTVFIEMKQTDTTSNSLFGGKGRVNELTWINEE